MYDPFQLIVNGIAGEAGDLAREIVEAAHRRDQGVNEQLHVVESLAAALPLSHDSVTHNVVQSIVPGEDGAVGHRVQRFAAGAQDLDHAVSHRRRPVAGVVAQDQGRRPKIAIPNAVQYIARGQIGAGGQPALKIVVAGVRQEPAVIQPQHHAEAEAAPVHHVIVEGVTSNAVHNIAHGDLGQVGLVAQFPVEGEVNSVLVDMLW